MGEKELKLFIKVGDDFEELCGISERVEKIELQGELEMRKSLLETILGGRIYKLDNKIIKLDKEVKSLMSDLDKLDEEVRSLRGIKAIVRFFNREENKRTYNLILDGQEIVDNIDFYGAKEAYKRLVKYVEFNREVNVAYIIRKELGKTEYINLREIEKQDN
jgi:hypothetical protein